MANPRKALAYLYFGAADRDKHDIFQKMSDALSESKVKKIVKELREKKSETKRKTGG